MKFHRKFRHLLWIAVIVALAAVIVRSPLNKPGNTPKPLKYSEFTAAVDSGQVAWVEIRDRQARGEFAKGSGRPKGEFSVLLPQNQFSQAQLSERLLAKGVTLEYPEPVVSERTQNTLVSVFVPLLAIGFLAFMLWRHGKAQGGQMGVNQHVGRKHDDRIPKVTFEDVAGVDEAKQELKEVVEFLKNPKKFQALGAKIPKGVLLLGSPGCGKTLLARAVAGEAGVPFYHISGSDFVEMFVGVGASRVRTLFQKAKSNSPSLIFIDEIDAVGRKRGSGHGGGHDEREQTLNQLLVEMDGFDPSGGVILIAATNRPDVLDPALLRPGRFDRRVVVDSPDVNGRRKILGVHGRGKPLADDVCLDVIARRTPGFTGADLANVINEAALRAAREDRHQITMADFESSIDRVVAGPERKSRVISEQEKAIVAYHEVGHAIVLELLEHSAPVHKVTILPRGMALGLTIQMPLDDRYLTSKKQMLAMITGFLGGRVAEALVFGDVTTGAQNDLERSSDIARRMVTEFGMSERLGPVALGKRHENGYLGAGMEERNYSDEVAKAIDDEVQRIMTEAYERAEQMLRDNYETMERVTQVLLERETLEREEFLAVMRGEELPEVAPAVTPSAPTDAPKAETPDHSPTPARPVLRPQANPA